VSNLSIPPSVDTSWRDDAQAAADALAILKLSATGPEAANMLQLAAAAGDRICNRLDRDAANPIPGSLPGVPPPTLRHAHALQTVYEWRQKDVGLGVANSWSPDQTGLVGTADDFAPGVEDSITPYRARWGIA
jgi:hypothetical protein